MRCFIVSGEPSGDKLGALIATALRDKFGADILAWGGPHFKKAGISIGQDTSDMAVMGYAQVVGRFPKFLKLLAKAKSQIKAFDPDTVVLVDYGGFNLKLAKWAHQEGYRVVYFSPPKVWATRASRIQLLKRYCDKIIVLYPFEQHYFRKKGLTVEYHGHPLADHHQAAESPNLSVQDRDTLKLILIPGSRIQEVEKILPPMLKAAKELGDYDVLVSCATTIDGAMLKSLIPTAFHDRTTIVKGELSALLPFADMALVTSGTATVEVALAGVPQVVCYKTSPLMYHIAKRLIKVKYISLVNLMMDRAVVTELIQDQCTGPIIAQTVRELENAKRRITLIEDYGEIKKQLTRHNSVEMIAKAIMGNHK